MYFHDKRLYPQNMKENKAFLPPSNCFCQVYDHSNKKHKELPCKKVSSLEMLSPFVLVLSLVFALKIFHGELLAFKDSHKAVVQLGNCLL